MASHLWILLQKKLYLNDSVSFLDSSVDIHLHLNDDVSFVNNSADKIAHKWRLVRCTMSRTTCLSVYGCHYMQVQGTGILWLGPDSFFQIKSMVCFEDVTVWWLVLRGTDSIDPDDTWYHLSLDFFSFLYFAVWVAEVGQNSVPVEQDNKVSPWEFM